MLPLRDYSSTLLSKTKFQFMMQRFQKFSDYTSMHGFVELFYAKTIFWKCFWTCVITASIGVTVYQVAGATSNFFSQPTITSIQQATTEDMLYPPLKICYPHWMYWVDFDKAIQMNFTRDGLLYGLSYLTNIYTTEMINEKEVKENYVRGMSLNNFTSVQDFYIAISSNRIIEFQPLHIPVENISESGLFAEDGAGLYPFFCHLINEDNVKSVIDATASSDFMSNQMGTPKSTSTKKFEFCVDNEKLFDLNEYVDPKEYSNYLTDWLRSMTSFKSNPATNLSVLSLPIMLYPNSYDSNAVFVSPETDIVKITLKASIHKWKNMKTSKCESDWRWIAPNKTCKHDCIKKFLAAYINASPNVPMAFGMAVLLNNYTINIQSNSIKYLEPEGKSVNVTRSLVTTTTLRTILDQNATSFTMDEKLYNHLYQTMTNCSRKCDTLYGCQLYTFDITQQHLMMFQGSRTYVEKSYTRVVIEYPTENEVLVMKEEDAKTWEDFVGNVGGLLGIWTGASVISFFQLVYLCCCAECAVSSLNGRTAEVSKKTSTALPHTNVNVISVKEAMDVEH